MATLAVVDCDLHNGLTDSTEWNVCVNPDGEESKIGKSVGYVVLRRNNNDKIILHYESTTIQPTFFLYMEYCD